MLVKNLVQLIETARIIVFPTNGQLGLKNGYFISLDINDDTLSDIFNEQIISVYVYNGLLAITI